MTRIWRAHVKTIYCKRAGTLVTRGGRAGIRSNERTKAFEAEVKAACRKAAGCDPLRNDGAFLGVVILDPIPPTWVTKRGKPTARAIRAMTQLEPAAANMDRDNIIKSVKDGAKGAWWKDDPKVAHAVFRAWAPSPDVAGIWAFCWEMSTPRDEIEIARGEWLDVVRSLARF